ncbi:MAG: sulfatase-like hydrolase/transferase [Myxococcales bacterium]|nr:sulfatase-like hydrolase/transferase [Myxococcales bacterium]
MPKASQKETALGRAVAAGLTGGMVAGAADAALAVWRLGDQLFGWRKAQLVCVGVALGAALGLALGGLGWALARASGRLGAASRWRQGVWPALLAAPVVWRAAFSLFSGPKASQIPGHEVLSWGLALLGVAVCGLSGVWVSVTVVEGARLGRVRILAGACWGALGVVATANAFVLPRLYPWFHETLAATALALAVLGAWLSLARSPRVRHTVVASLVAASLCAAVAQQALANRRQVRFALFDKTAALGVYARFVPLPSARRVSLTKTRRDGGNAPAAPVGEGPKRPGADVILVTVDALRPDHVGAYGYARPTTPALDALARTSTRFVRAYTQAPHTSFATTSMLTGKYYPTLLRLKQGDEGEPITTIVRRYGWKTAAFYPPAVFFVGGDKLAAFRDSGFQFEYLKVEFLDAEARIDQIASYFETVKPERAFLWVHFFEPHEPYERHEGHDFGPNDRDRYDSEVAYTDAAIARLLAYLEARRPNAIVIVSADHGEEFDEHGGRYHGSTLYEEQVRVPLIIHVPGLPARIVEGQAELVDLAPTILSLLDIPLPARMRGTDLGPWLAGASDEAMPPAFAEVEDKRMVVHRGDKLICGGQAGACQLFDLKNDPTERQNLIDEAPERAQALTRLLDEWLDAQGQLEALEAPAESGQLPRALARGRLGDAEAAPGLLALVSAPGPAPLREEAARLLVSLPPQTELAGALSQAVPTLEADVPGLATWVAVAAFAAGSPSDAVQARVRQALALPHAEVPAGTGPADPEAPSMDLPLAAALALAETGASDGAPTLRRALERCDGGALCRRVVRAVARLQDPGAVPALHAALEHVNVRLEVVKALGSMQDLRSVPVLVQALRFDERVPVRAEAARALGRMGVPAARRALSRAARRERERVVADAIAGALRGDLNR